MSCYYGSIVVASRGSDGKDTAISNAGIVLGSGNGIDKLTDDGSGGLMIMQDQFGAMLNNT